MDCNDKTLLFIEWPYKMFIFTILSFEVERNNGYSLKCEGYYFNINRRLDFSTISFGWQRDENLKKKSNWKREDMKRIFIAVRLAARPREEVHCCLGKGRNSEQLRTLVNGRRMTEEKRKVRLEEGVKIKIGEF